MADSFFGLSRREQLDALLVAASRSGRSAHLLEKDIWVVWVLRALFDSDFAQHLVFNGGTSLSKAYHAIARFSEDVDLTYDIRAIAPDLVAGSDDAIPHSRSQQDRWTDVIRERLPEWIQGHVSPLLSSQLSEQRLNAQVTSAEDVTTLRYESLVAGTGYVTPIVLLEFGARSTGEPCETKSISCDAAVHLPHLEFPEAEPKVMRAERTFWEKATAIHVFCRGGRFRGHERFSRHWYDLVGLDQTGFANMAIADRELARQVARHKAVFFREQTADGQVISYETAVGGSLELVPAGEPVDLLARDYAALIEDGLLFAEPPGFDALLTSCREIQDRANLAAVQ